MKKIENKISFQYMNSFSAPQLLKKLLSFKKLFLKKLNQKLKIYK